MHLVNRKKKTIQKSLEQNHVKKEKCITKLRNKSYVIGQRNSSKKLDSLHQSESYYVINDCDVIKAYYNKSNCEEKRSFFQSERTK